MRRISRRAAIALAAGTAGAPVVNMTPVAAAAPEPSTTSGRPMAIRAELITAVTPRDNWRVIAVAIRCTGRIDLRGGTIPSSAFEVTVTIGGTTTPRNVTRVYPNGTPEVADRGRPGEYLIVELNPADTNARAAGTDPLPLDRAYAVRQLTDIVSSGGDVILAASPFAVRNDDVITPVVDVITPVVDDFAAGSFTDSAGFRLAFRVFRPADFVRDPGRRTRFPLVVTLHGGGEVADNNMTQLTGNRVAVTFAKPERQRAHPAFVLAPQIPLPRPMEGPDGTDWTDARVQAATVQLIDSFVAWYPVDTDRIYLAGPSSGGRGIFSLLAKYPRRFAAAMPTAGWGETSAMEKIADIPLWTDHSVDDPVVPYREGRFGKPGSWTLMNALEAAGATVTRGEWANNLPKADFEARSRTLLQEARTAGSHVLFTSYTAGTTPVNPHLSWAQTYENDVVIEWLFAQRRR